VARFNELGGRKLDARQVGTAAARIAARMLQGEGVSGSNAVIEMQVLAFDWRELDRWRIPESRLPAGAEVRFRPPSLWEQHRAVILAGAAIVLLQAALISALLLQHARRRRAEKETVDLGGRLLTAHEDERRRLARELHDDLSQRLARAAIDAGRMENAPAAPEGMRPLREDLVRLSEDVHALSYRLHPSVLDDLGLVEALKAECDRVARHAALRVEVNARGVPEALPGDASLCLFRVAQEALNNAARHAGASAVTVLLSPSRQGLQLAVSVSGEPFAGTSVLALSVQMGTAPPPPPPPTPQVMLSVTGSAGACVLAA
jgi:signal transduction histidine kinase